MSKFYLFVEGLALIITLGLFVALVPGIPQPVCLEHAQVKAITELRYRDAVIEMSNGASAVVNQETLKPGDTVCAKWGKK